MARKVTLIIIFLFFCISVCGSDKAYFSFDEFECTIYNTRPKQGDMVFIKIMPLKDIIPEKVGIDQENQLQFIRFREYYLSVFGIDFRVDPNVFSIRIYYSYKGQQKHRDIDVNYSKRAFDIWELPGTIPRARTRTPAEQKRREEEVQAIYGALRHITPRLYILDGYTSPIKGSKISEYRAFGQKRMRGGQEISRHRGVDISRPRGTPVYSPLSGVVVLTGNDFFFEGNTLIIDNGLGIFTIFCHLHSFLVEEGDIVATGDMVGTVGSTGRATGPHLHWQIKFLLKDVNPLSFDILNELISDLNKK